MNARSENGRAWLWLTAPIALLLALAAGGGLFVSGLYRDNATLVAQAVGQDLVSLVVVLPALIVSAILAGRGSPRGQLVWLGALVYLVYTYLTYTFAIRFNALFVVYVALLGCSVYALVGGLATTDLPAIKAAFAPGTPVRAASRYLVGVAGLFYVLWLSEVVPALLAGVVPQSVLDTGTPSNVVYVVDLALLLPALVIAAISLSRKQPLGYTLAGMLLAHLVFLLLAVLGMGILELRRGEAGAASMVALFGALTAISLGMLIWYLRGLGLSRARRPGSLAAGAA